MRAHVVMRVWLCCLSLMQAACHSSGQELKRGAAHINSSDDGSVDNTAINDGPNVLLSRRLHKHRRKRDEQSRQPKEQEPPQQLAVVDYSDYSCDEINEMEYKHSNINSNNNPRNDFDRCQFAMTCNGGDGILFPTLFCTSSKNGAASAKTDTNFRLSSSTTMKHILNSIKQILLLIGLAFILLLLFRLLNSTTDEFFSPGLELFSLHLGLPPRFAGVTLLALGNGAPDVAATMNAMLQDEKNGYLMAMGELTGTTMFVSAVILGVIVRLSGNNHGGDKPIDDDEMGAMKENDINGKSIVNGVPCKGPFLRDISVLCLVTVVSMSYFEQGVIDYGFVHSMLGIYVVYVVLVFGADAYHIFYHLPKLAREEEHNGDIAKESEGENVISVEYGRWKDGQQGDGNHEKANTPVNIDAQSTRVADECTPLTHSSPRSDDSHLRQHRHHLHSRRPHSHTLGDTVIEAISNYSCHEQQRSHTNERSFDGCSGATTTEIEQMQSFSSTRSNLPTSKSSGWGPTLPDGKEPLVTFHPHHAIHPHHEGGPLILRRGTSSGSGDARTLSHGESSDSYDGNQRSIPGCNSNTWNALSSAAAVVSTWGEANSGSSTVVCMDQRRDDANIQRRPNCWGDAWTSNTKEWNAHWIEFFRGIYQNGDNSALEVVCLSVELPFTILRKLTNPVPCDGYYCRPVVAVSFALSPLWVYYYFNDQFGVNIFSSSIGFILCIVNVLIAALILRYSPDGEGPMDFFLVVSTAHCDATLTFLLHHSTRLC
eukprot:CCRYP_011305-RA/>CCRYP_011305-RA protein AED:0.03 eAED:0.03 QI:364/1/1/1/1/0.83/6/2737/766